MVVGPLMQGVVLAGIIYWYSKGMMSMINDYYRSEFNRKLKIVNETATEAPNYDLDDFESFINIESAVKSVEIAENSALETIVHDFVDNDLKVINEKYCYAPTAIDIFLYIVGLNVTQQELECWAMQESNFDYKIS